MILLTRDNKISYLEFGDSQVDGFEDVTDEGLVKWLSEEVKFGEGLTFRDFCRHLVSEKDDINRIFFSSTRGHKLERYMADLDSVVADTELKAVQIAWRVEVNGDRLDVNCGFSGVGFEGAGNRENGVESSYGLSLTSLGSYADLPFKLNPRFIVENYQNKTLEIQLESEKQFMLFDVVRAVLYEITRDGYPEERDLRAEELKSRVERSEQEIEKGNYYTTEELMERINQRFNQ